MTPNATRPAAWKLLVAYAIIYLVWGSTYLFIRIGVREMPPFLMAGLRFTIAGLGLYAWMRLSGTPSPDGREWRSATLLGALMFLIDYACLFWAEQRVPSGISAVILATIPVVIALLESVVLRTMRLTLALALGLVTGLIGVGVVVNPLSSLGGAALDRWGAMALLLACLGWSVGTIVTPRLVLPASKAMSAAAQMLSGGVQLLALAALSGEFGRFHVRHISPTAWFSLLYLIIAGSIVAFTAYVWLLHYESASKVGTYAYVNPVVAVILGAAFGGEGLGRRTVAGTALILLGVGAITRSRIRGQRALVQDPSDGKRQQAPAD
ncbi:MAG: EamA family transporter [Acidobacteria bacterium]|nr:EamA family transporter [Acidobacteriota bacterium]MBV9625553.1 EamA family transporter [Acidobacteriota bacterium]